jgi:hypothetical protein
VLVVYVVSYDEGARKRVLGRSARVAGVEGAGWSPSSFGGEVDVGGSGQCWDPCVAATRDGTFVVAYTSSFRASKIEVRFTEDAVGHGWSDPVTVCPDFHLEPEVAKTEGIQNFASISIDEVNGRCFVCWEDTYGPVQHYIATSNGAVAEITDLETWIPLGVLTGHDVPERVDEAPDDPAVKRESTRYPCVVATAGRPRVFYRAVNRKAELLSRLGRWT